MTYAELEQQVAGLTEQQTCPVCRDTGLITCPCHMSRTEDGWCWWCDSPDLPAQILCPCQHLTA
ncbi:hypothetical protein O7627_24480 [Solwaraspora sp. WMMD1047]|uniref:hypothetical protein n=1 Tax=Solwaraspora sp. WMMD1047 TaxID=3016102 RepID=UPI0024171D99|nr:hypothetical protein [Solwaraspora sp. WMMD1047]MDG4832441.1 hypothetical protein [Solwaraspora sp. WMMD1047]